MAPDPEHDDERAGADPLPPEDRLWRHPSELGSGAGRPDVSTPPRGRGPRESHSLALGALAGACLAGAAVAFGAMWLTRPTRVVERSSQAVAARPVATTGVAVRTVPTEQLAHSLGPSLPSVRSLHDGTWTSGTGVWLDRNGALVTAAPLVAGATQVVVTGQDGVGRRAQVAGTDPATGITTLTVARTSGVALAMEAGPARAGEAVAILGAPSAQAGTEANEGTTAMGVVRTASVRVELSTGVMHDAIQLDRTVPADALGGLLVDAYGRVVGIAVARSTERGLGAASPADWAMAAAADLRDHGKVTRARLGVEATDLEPDVASELRVSGGAHLIAVQPDSPAAAAGLRVDDVVVQVDKRRIDDASDLVSTLQTHQPGNQVVLTLFRNGHTTTIAVTLGR